MSTINTGISQRIHDVSGDLRSRVGAAAAAGSYLHFMLHKTAAGVVVVSKNSDHINQSMQAVDKQYILWSTHACMHAALLHSRSRAARLQQLKQVRRQSWGTTRCSW